MSRTTQTSLDRPTWFKHWYWLALAAIILLTAAIRYRLLDVPLERDEGEYAYIAQMMLKGVPPYISAYSMKLPGIYAIYALILYCFGQTHSAIHLGLIIVNAATILVLFLLVKRLIGPLAAVAAAAAYAVTSLGQHVLGLSANAEHFVILPAMAAFLILTAIPERRRLLVVFIASLLLGLAFIIKQHGIFFVLFGAAYLLYGDLHSRPIRWKMSLLNQLVFLTGASIPYALTCLLLWHAGVFENFWFWTFTYAHKYATIVPLSRVLHNFSRRFTPVVASVIIIWLFAVLGLLTVLFTRRLRVHAPFILGFFVFSFLAICPGFYFREHYFLFLLPAVAILAGLGVSGFNKLLARRIPGPLRAIINTLIFLILFGFSLFHQREFLLFNTPTAVCRQIYGGNPFPESLPIAEYIRQNSSPDDLIAVIGSEPQIYFYANRRSATTYIYTYPLLEPQPLALKMQQEMIHQIETAKPLFLISVNVQASWKPRPNSSRLILDWFNKYHSQYYDVVGIADIVAMNHTEYRWDEQALTYKPKSNFRLSIHRRKD